MVQFSEREMWFGISSTGWLWDEQGWSEPSSGGVEREHISNRTQCQWSRGNTTKYLYTLLHLQYNEHLLWMMFWYDRFNIYVHVVYCPVMNSIVDFSIDKRNYKA